jgi:hypothetical protein
MQTPASPPKTPYQTPKLEIHDAWRSVVGIGLSIGPSALDPNPIPNLFELDVKL